MGKDKFLIKIWHKIKDFVAKQNCFAQPIPLYFTTKNLILQLLFYKI
jgi:hypothetical protein